MKKKQEDELKVLLESKRKTLERLERVKKRLKEEKENEEIWLGHEGTEYKTDWEDYGVLESHLEEIEKEIVVLQKKREVSGPEV